MKRYARLNKIYGRFVQFGGTPEGVRRIVFSCKGRTGGVRPERLRVGQPRRTAARRSCRREAGVRGCRSTRDTCAAAHTNQTPMPHALVAAGTHQRTGAGRALLCAALCAALRPAPGGGRAAGGALRRPLRRGTAHHPTAHGRGGQVPRAPIDRAGRLGGTAGGRVPRRHLAAAGDDEQRRPRHPCAGRRWRRPPR